MKKFRLFIICLIFCFPIFFAGCENKNMETLSTPNIINVENGTIVFEQVEDAEYYTLFIDDYKIIVDAKHSNSVEIIDNKINFDASNLLQVGQSCAIKVQANAKDKHESEFSTPYSYQHGENVKVAQNVKINGTTLTWDTDQSASYYLVKIITPNDKVIFNKNGEVVTLDDAESIENAVLPEYTFNDNAFNFSSILSTAGEYKFYVATVFSEGGKLVKSKYSSKQSYLHNVTLQNPTVGTIKNVNGELFLDLSVDENTNAISIKCNNVEKSCELNSSETSITKIAKNYFSINLNKYFEQFFSSSALNMNVGTSFAISVQAKHISANNSNLFSNSGYVSTTPYVLKENLPAPTLSVVYNSNIDAYIASWSCESNHVSSFTLLLCASDGVEKINLDSQTTSKIIFEDFISIAVVANGNDVYLNSGLSNFVSKPGLTQQETISNCNKHEESLIWDHIEDAYYIVEINNSYEIIDVNYCNMIKSNNPYDIVKITVIKENNRHFTKSFEFDNLTQLQTPKIINQQTDEKTNYYLYISQTQNTFGYYVFLKQTDVEDFTKIDHLFTTQTIDLSKYILTNSNTSYEIKIQAVAESFSNKTNSELSSSTFAITSKKHQTPTYFKINGVETPIVRTTENNADKFTLKFFGVKNTKQYEVIINSTKFVIEANLEDECGLYEKDVTEIINHTGIYEVQLRAISNDDLISNYNIKRYNFKHQLDKVQNLQLITYGKNKVLTFQTDSNVDYYLVRIVRVADPLYSEKLAQNGLDSTFTTTGPTDISDYLVESGAYYAYVTACATPNNLYYYDSLETQLAILIK